MRLFKFSLFVVSAFAALVCLQACSSQTGHVSTPKKSVIPEEVVTVESKPTGCQEIGLIQNKNFRSEVTNKSDEFQKKLDQWFRKETAKRGGNTYRIKSMMELQVATNRYIYKVEGYAYDCPKKK